MKIRAIRADEKHETAMRSILLLLTLAGSLCGAEWGKSFLNNEGLVLLARAGYGEKFLTELVQSQPSRFDTSVEGLVFLAKNGMSERMVRCVIQAKRRADEAEDMDAPPPAPGAAAPMRLKAMKQTVLVPESMAGAKPGGQVILLDPRYVLVR